MLFAATKEPAGNKSKMTMNVTHDTAIIPMGIYHLPRLNGPGTNCFLPDVIIKNIGIAYEV